MFRKFGTILSVHTMINKMTGLSRGFGFISFQDAACAEEAIRQMNGFRVRDFSRCFVYMLLYFHILCVLLGGM